MVARSCTSRRRLPPQPTDRASKRPVRSAHGSCSVPTARGPRSRGSASPAAARRPSYLRITRSCARRSRSRRATTAAAAMSTIRANCHRISMPGCSPTATPSARVLARRTRDSRSVMPSATCGASPGSRALRFSDARARRSRSNRCDAGTTVATCWWRAMPPAWSLRPRARASTTRWPAVAWPPTP